ncbi:MAG: YerC/YecD family TrpR-related protein [Clostridia bacterium]|nr:YerC/YecD family TrpR-related protein [Clostridia bacterium]
MTYHSKLATEFLNDLFDAILLLKNREECYRFFEDVCTIKELQAISQRLQVAKLLRANKTYHEIEEITGASTATISRVNRCVLYGADGYNIILDRLQREEEINNGEGEKEK